MPASHPSRHAVALEGFSAFERKALVSYFLHAGSDPAYEQVATMAQAEFVVADADDPAAVNAVVDAGRVGDSVFIGARAPDGALAWMMRPIDPPHVARELDAMVALRHRAHVPAPSRRSAARATGGRRASDAEDPTPGAAQ
jgi:hypothetical protein